MNSENENYTSENEINQCKLRVESPPKIEGGEFVDHSHDSDKPETPMRMHQIYEDTADEVKSKTERRNKLSKLSKDSQLKIKKGSTRTNPRVLSKSIVDSDDEGGGHDAAVRQADENEPVLKTKNSRKKNISHGYEILQNEQSLSDDNQSRGSSDEESVHTDESTADVRETTNSGRRQRSKNLMKSDDHGQDSKSSVSEKILEARKDFDEALGKLKGLGNRRRSDKDTLADDPMNLDEMASDLRIRMEDAAFSDKENINAGKPALFKYQMLPEVSATLNKKHLQEALLDAGILRAIKLWLEPLPDQTLPSPVLRKTLLDLMRSLPVELDHLRESGVGKIVYYLSIREKETPEVQRIAKELVSRWSRPILASSDGSKIRESQNSEEIDEDEADEKKSWRSTTAPVLQSRAYRRMVDSGGLEGGSTSLSVSSSMRSMASQKRARR